MAIRMVPDVGAPLAVAGIDILTKETIPGWNNWVVYGMTGLGYLAGYVGWGGDFIKQMGVSSLPLTAEKIYERVRGGAVTSSARLAFRKKVARYPAPAYEGEFAGARIT